jgi:hypothetical protein
MREGCCICKMPLTTSGLLTLSDCDHDQGKDDKPDEHDIQFVKPGEDTAEALQSPEQPFRTSLRFLYSSLSCSQGSVRLFFGGTTGEKPSSAASFLV